MADRKHRALALFSGGLDSLLSVVWMRKHGYEVLPVTFTAAYIPPDKAEKSARENGLELIVKDISEAHLAMLQNPVHGYGKNFNPCIDCHALMFEQAGKLLCELDADYLISGEVLGQRPMSQRRNSLQAVEKLSGYGDLIVRPLSQRLLPDTLPIRENWVDKNDLLAIHGRGRTQQMELAAQFGLSYPAPGGGCLLTDRNFSLRLKDLFDHGQASAANIRLLRWGRHFRLNESIKLIVGRTQADNAGLEAEDFPGVYFKLRDVEGPLGLLTASDPSEELLRLAASIILHYSPKAASRDWLKYGVDKNYALEIEVEKCPEPSFRPYLISLDKDR